MIKFLSGALFGLGLIQAIWIVAYMVLDELNLLHSVGSGTFVIVVIIMILLFGFSFYVKEEK